VYSQKKAYLVSRIRTEFAAIYSDKIDNLAKLKVEYINIEKKWSALCENVELTSASDKAFAKFIVFL